MRRLGISQIKCGQFWPYFCILIDAGPTSFCPYTYIFWQFCWTNYSSTLIYFYRSHDLIRWLLWRHLRAVPKFPLDTGELEMQDCNNVTVRSFSWSPGRGRDGLRGGYCPDCPMKQALVPCIIRNMNTSATFNWNKTVSHPWRETEKKSVDVL